MNAEAIRREVVICPSMVKTPFRPTRVLTFSECIMSFKEIIAPFTFASLTGTFVGYALNNPWVFFGGGITFLLSLLVLSLDD